MAALDGVLRSTVLEGVSWLPLMLMLSMLPFGMVLTFFNALLQSQRKLVTFNVIYGMASLIHLVAMFVALYVFDAGVLGAVVATMLSVFIPAMVSLARVMLTVRLRPRLDPGIIRELVSFGLKSHAQFVLNATLSKIDLPIMNLYLSPAAVGIYSVAQSLVGRTLNLPTAVSTALYPHMVATESDAEMDGITESACRNLLALVALVAVAAAIIAKPVIVLLFGEEFREAYVPFLLLLIGVVPQGSYQILSRNFASRGRPLIAAIPTAVALIVSVVGDIVLIPRVGINGAAITSALAAILMFVMGLGIYSKLSKRPWWNAVLIQPSDFHAYRRLGKRVGHRVRRLAPRSAG
jgi:O-antigen/teichoic acid export membrane protein